MSIPFVPDHPKFYCSKILHQMAEQQNSGLTDFILSSHGQKIPCHRGVLAAACPYFEAMFSSGLIEAQEGEAVMDNVDFHILKFIVEYMYGKCPLLSWDDVEKLLETCELMQLNQLKEMLEDYVESNVTAKNCIVWMKNAETFHLDKIVVKAKSLMIEEFQNVSKSADFLKLSYAEVVDFIRNVEESLSSQDQVLHAIIRWVSAYKEHRKSFMMDVLKLVNLEKCSADSIDDVTKAQSDLFQEPDVMRLVYHSVLPRLKESEKKLKNSTTQSVLLLGGTGFYGADCYTKCWQWSVDFANCSWQKITNVPKVAVGEQPSFVWIPDGFAVFCGGEDKIMNAKYDLKDRKWFSLPSTPESLQDTVALYTDGKVHILDGGSNDSESTRSNTMYTLNLQTLKWSKGPSLLVKQSLPRATAHEGSLWVVYNNDTDKCHVGYESIRDPCLFQLLAPDASEWVYKASLPVGEKNFGACLIGYKDNLFLLGGEHQVCVRYNIGADQWTVMNSRPTLCHQYGSAFVLDQKIFLCGGAEGGDIDEISDHIESYDPETDQWTWTKRILPKKMIFCTACSLVDGKAN